MQSPFTWLNEQVEKVVMPEEHPTAVARKAICDSCPQSFQMPIVHHVTGPQCLMCGCFLGAKTRTVREKCPLGHW